MNRRAFLERTIWGAGGLATSRVWGATQAKTRQRPNVLFIWTDQQNATAMSCAGNPWLNTPAMDSLAAAGVRFEQCHCSNPICVPSRTSWLTGRMPHETGVQYNAERAPLTLPALTRSFRDAGFATGYVGKWHIPRDVNDVAWNGLEFRRETRGSKIDDQIVLSCNDFFDTKREDTPFFLVASFMNPHDICEWAREAAGMESPLPNGQLPPAPNAADCPPLPDNFAIPDSEPEIVRKLAAAAPRTYPTQSWSDSQWRQYLWAYYRLVERVDEQIGYLLDSLKRRGLFENTLIVFSSDHGDGAASHRWNQKTLFYDEVVRIPFIVRPPGGLKASRVDRRSLVNLNLDFFPTVFDYTGITPPNGLAGRSLRPLVERRPGARGHKMIVSQSEPAPVYDTPSGAQGRMLTDGRWKYIRYSHGANPEQLFDRKTDPGELTDLSKNPRYAVTLERWRERLRDWMTDNGDSLPNASEPVSFLS